MESYVGVGRGGGQCRREHDQQRYEAHDHYRGREQGLIRIEYRLLCFCLFGVVFRIVLGINFEFTRRITFGVKQNCVLD